MPFARRLPAPVPPSAAVLLLLPLSVLAGGVLFWPAACLVAIRAANVRQHGAMLAWYGLAVGFDARALLLAPFVAAVLIGRRVRWPLLPVAPLCAAVMVLAHGHAGLPTLILPQDLALSDGAPNLWSIAGSLPWICDLPLTGLAVSAALGTAAAYVAWVSSRPIDGEAPLDAALLCALMMPSLLPGLGASAFLLGAALALAAALLRRTLPHWQIALLVMAGTLAATLSIALVPLGAVAIAIAIILQARRMVKPAANDNPLLARNILSQAL